MTDPTITDLRRELDKARDALIAAQTYLAYHAEANAALHCATTHHSPLHAKVTAAIGGIEHALLRTEQAVTEPMPEWRREEADQDRKLAAVLMDLDRCFHGRHQGDVCGGCSDGRSGGNPYMPPSNVVGYSVHADPIVMPDRDRKHDPAAWRPTRTKETP